MGHKNLHQPSKPKRRPVGDRCLVDIAALRWGRAPVPLLPKPLCDHWKNDELPDNIIANTKLPAGSKVDALGISFWDLAKELSACAERSIRDWAKARIWHISDAKCCGRAWPLGLKLVNIPFTPRSRKCLQWALEDNNCTIEELSFRDLLRTPNLAIKAALEITTLIEAAIDIYERVAAKLSEGANTQPNETLRWLLQKPWVDSISSQDPRFSALLPAETGTLAEQIKHCLSGQSQSAFETMLVGNIRRICNVVTRIETQTIEQVLGELLAGFVRPLNPRNVKIMTVRFGWDGQTPKSLEECAGLFSVTRERIRQIQIRIVRRIPALPIFLPQIDAALALLENAAPIQVDSAAKLLVQHGISGVPFSPTSLIMAVHVLGRKTPLRTRTIRGVRMVVNTAS